MYTQTLLDKCYCFLPFTVKAKTSEEVVNNRPAAGILDKTLAAEYKVISSPVHCIKYSLTTNYDKQLRKERGKFADKIFV